MIHEGMRVVEAWLAYLDARAMSPKTIRRRRIVLRSFVEDVAPSSFDEVTADMVDAWLSRHLRPNTRAAYRSDLVQFYRWAMRRRVVRNDPMVDVDPIRRPRAIPHPLDFEKVKVAIALADDRTGTAMMIAVYAGLRVFELAQLDWLDVRLNSRPPIIAVRQGKGAKDRDMPIHPTLHAWLSRREQATGPVLESRADGGGYLTDDRVGQLIGEALAVAGLRGATPHHLRHTFGSEAARASGGDMLAVAELMGHASMNTSRGYTRWTGDAASVVTSMFAA